MNNIFIGLGIRLELKDKQFPEVTAERRTAAGEPLTLAVKVTDDGGRWSDVDVTVTATP